MSQPASVSFRQADYQKREPEKGAARRALRVAIATGLVIRPDACEACGTVGRPHGHHHDYSRPLEVEWLCAKCHGEAHAALRRRLAAEYKAAAAAGPKSGSEYFDMRRVGSRRRAILSRLCRDREAFNLRWRLIGAIACTVGPSNPTPVPERLLEIRRSVTLPPDRRRVIEELVATYR